MTEFVNVTKPGVSRTLAPEAIVLMDPSNGATMGSAASPMAMVLIDPATGLAYSAAPASTDAPADREIETTHYRVKTAFSEGAVDDVVTFTRILDMATMLMVGAIWVNQTTSAELTVVPMANFEIVGVSKGSYGAGPVDASTLRVTLASDGPVVSAVGNTGDASASSDAGAFSLIALLKRGLGNWTALLAKIPAQVGGRMPVDGSGVTQPVSAAALPLPLGAATAANQPALVAGRAAMEPLGQPDVARVLAATSASVNIALTATCRRVSIKARTSDARFVVGAGAQTALVTSHYIQADERLDFAVPAGANIAVMRDSAATVDGLLQITELV